MPSDKAVFENLAQLEGLSLREHAAAERLAIEALDRILRTPRSEEDLPRREQPEYKNLLALVARLKVSNACVVRRLDEEAALVTTSRKSTEPHDRTPQHPA